MEGTMVSHRMLSHRDIIPHNKGHENRTCERKTGKEDTSIQSALFTRYIFTADELRPIRASGGSS